MPLVLAAGSLVSACGSSTSATGAAACKDVTRSLALYHRSEQQSGATAAHTRADALTALRHALRKAALIGSAGGSWQALAATLQESNRVPESDLVHALSAQCAALTGGNGG